MKSKTAFVTLFLLLTQILTACGGNWSFAAPTPTAQPTPTNDPRSASKVVQAFWDALEDGDLDTAMTYVADDITCEGFCHFSGKETFRSYLHGYLQAGHVTKIGNVKNVGNIVTYSWEVYRNGFFRRRGEADEIMEVENGKIIYWENYHQ